MFPWDRFAHYIEAPAPIPPGTYSVVLSVSLGRIGWRTATVPGSFGAAADDGLSFGRVDGVALRDERSLVAPAPWPWSRSRHRTPFFVTSSRCPPT